MSLLIRLVKTGPQVAQNCPAVHPKCSPFSLPGDRKRKKKKRGGGAK